MVSIKQAADGIASFVEAEWLPALEGWQLWAGAAALALAKQRGEVFITGLASNKIVGALGLIDADGMVDIDAAIAALKETAHTKGKLSVDLSPLGEFRLGEADFDTLLEHIRKAGA